mmetsp:Transcript_3288/g.4165  ORF Transcript_3288/g.4165 Transcript_3288/m.4165 type:complete len:132 (+) Transcript_3288:159-554(+)|eukprot:CAMPEP_0204860158 /NCGR_PEP_ID=MMETSP1347-20130617/24142_1 /ASSEMBLY_ACC=CAM_ASM_000690 /TAXON_ID=215587 /ORGANISM="Aplanochytrium stocchinoi, Strain GSBS06" /LENGTH=131 /DNA_ID=CAMNT_0052008803 /DNA_START=44 /DNA_END=439 /DNA_ORIENTATION=-
MGDKCNRDQFLSDRASTRTHHHMASHHSKSSWSLGWTEEEQKPAPTTTTESVPVAEPPSAKEAPVPEQKPMVDRTNTTAEATAEAPALKKSGVSSNAYANGSNQNAGNFITDRPTTRVHAPPGGRSQITFG